MKKLPVIITLTLVLTSCYPKIGQPIEFYVKCPQSEKPGFVIYDMENHKKKKVGLQNLQPGLSCIVIEKLIYDIRYTADDYDFSFFNTTDSLFQVFFG